MAGNWQDRAAVWPLWAWITVFGVPTGVAYALLGWLLVPRRGVVDVTVQGVCFGVTMSGCLWWARRRDRSITADLPRAARIEVSRALRVGDAPREPALDRTVLALIDRRRGQVRRSWRIIRWFPAVFVIGALALLVTEPGVHSAVLVLLSITLAVALPVAVRRQRIRLDRAEGAIRARSAG